MRSVDLRSKSDVALALAQRGSARILVAYAVVLLTVRLIVGGSFGWGDLTVLVVTVVMSGPTEWLIHKFALHAPDDAWTGRVLKTGVGHKQHHLDPQDIDSLMLRNHEAALFSTMFGIVTAAWAIPLMWLAGLPMVGPFLTGWMLAAIGLVHYEAVHLVVHTRYRCKTRYYARLARNHRWHHYRNENYWLGVTSNLGDRILRTYPAAVGDVPLSPTARTLGAEASSEPGEIAD